MKRKLLLLSVIALMLLGAFGASAQDEPLPLKIGLLVDQSGGLAVYGFELEYGFKLGLLYAAGVDPSEYDSIDEALAAVTIGGRPVEILVRDNASDPDTAASQARELIETEFVEILVGAPSSGVTVALQQVALDNDVILFAAPGASPAITGANFNPNTFRVCRNTFQDSAALGAISGEVGPNWMILAADYEFGRGSAAAFEAGLPAYGVTFAGETIYAPLETTDFTPYIQEILAAEPDALLTIWAGDGAVAMFQQLNELGVTENTVLVGGTNSNDVAAVATTPDQIGSYTYIVYHYTMPDNEVNDWMVEKHIEFFPNPATGETDYPDLFTECSFSTAQALVQAVEATSGDTLPEVMIPVLEGMKIESPKGEIVIRPADHQALVPLYVMQIDNIDDPEFKFYTPISEVSALDAAPPCLLEGDYAERCEANEEFMSQLAEEMGTEE